MRISLGDILVVAEHNTLKYPSWWKSRWKFLSKENVQRKNRPENFQHTCVFSFQVCEKNKFDLPDRKCVVFKVLLNSKSFINSNFVTYVHTILFATKLQKKLHHLETYQKKWQITGLIQAWWHFKIHKFFTETNSSTNISEAYFYKLIKAFLLL